MPGSWVRVPPLLFNQGVVAAVIGKGLATARRSSFGRYRVRRFPRLTVMCGIAASTGLTACDATGPSGDTTNVSDDTTVVSVEIRNERSDTLFWPFDALTLTAVARNAAGTEVVRVVTWTTSHASRISITPFSTLFASQDMQHAYARVLDLGDVTVTATVGGITAQRRLTGVVPPDQQMFVWPDTSRLVTSTSRVLRVQRMNGLNSGPLFVGDGITWETADPEVAGVDAAGRVNAVAPGQARITATFSGRSVSAEVFVVREEPPLRLAGLVVGDMHSCGLTSVGWAYCWGHSSHGQIGSDSILDRCARYQTAAGVIVQRAFYRCSPTPILVDTPVRFAALSARGRTTCGIALSGEAYCWGRNVHGMTGAGLADSTVARPTPVLGGINFRSIEVGLDQACGVSTVNVAYCWGNNIYGSLGNGTQMSSSIPVAVSGGHSWQVVSAGSTACGVTTDNEAHCWGQNDRAQVGTPASTMNCAAPVPRPCTTSPLPVSGQQFVTAASDHWLSCGLTIDGRAYCWGDLFLGATTGTATPTPTAVDGGHRFESLHHANTGYCGVVAEGSVYCWNERIAATRARVPDFSIRELALGPKHACALDAEGLVHCWDGTPIGTSTSTTLNPHTFFWTVHSFWFWDVGTAFSVTASSTPQRVGGQ
jgi:hypothetical protein